MHKIFKSSMLVTWFLVFSPLCAMQNTLKHSVETFYNSTHKAVGSFLCFRFSEDKVMKFANPTRDAVAKYLLDDQDIRNSFLRALTPFKNISYSDNLDTSLRLLRLDENLLNILSQKNFKSDLKNAITKAEKGDGRTQESASMLRFHKGLLKNFDRIQSALLDEKGPVSDVICKLDTGQHVLVEVQVINPQDYVWDQRAVAYASLLYGGQLRKGQGWHSLQTVTALNILSVERKYNGVEKPFWPEGSDYKRHFDMTNRRDRSQQIDSIEIIQYSLGNVVLNKVQDKEERAWLDFFRNAPHYDHIPANSPKIIEQAYKRIQHNKLPPQVKELYVTEEENLSNYAARFRHERAEGEKQKALDIAKAIQENGMSIFEIVKCTGLSEEEIEKL